MIQTILGDGETSFGPYTTCLCEIKGHNGTFRTLFKYKATFLVCKNLETFLRFKKNTLHKTFYYKEVIKIESGKIRAEIIQHKIENHIFCTERTVIINQDAFYTFGRTTYTNVLKEELFLLDNEGAKA